ncbi:MAG TPA: class I SAM-dependent methyltransferase [Candidatus Wunengus sp. YC63]|uniref:class I SAM-dependent methyltransferase n=1 Tax=Candidatus Wunengus sp. YC63 TaxID=3367699 RepID=UPI002713F0EE|nr:class I SAM-dependent methyltransferase [Candidatus Brocadiales bacterium]
MIRDLTDLTSEKVLKMSYVDLLSLMNETNRPPGGKDTIRQIALNAFVSSKHRVLEIGCSTGFSSIEISCITGCQVSGIDPNEIAIATAKKNSQQALVNDRVLFQIGDATHLPFDNEMFHLVHCGGAIAWIQDKKKAISECMRVLRFWGFITAVPLYYHKSPPKKLIEELNTHLGIVIQPWGKDFWISLFESEGLESYHTIDQKIFSVSDHVLKDYIDHLISPLKPSLQQDVLEAIRQKAMMYFSTFNENHKYLSYSIMLFRKRPVSEQRSLF